LTTPPRFAPDKEGEYCVGAIATDSQGASGFGTLGFLVENKRPIARTVMLAPSVPAMATAVSSGAPPPVQVPLFSDVRLTGKMSEDDDPQTSWRYMWKVTGPGGREPAACTGATAATDGEEICRRLEVAGDYKFELIVRDGQIESVPAEQTVVAAPDTLPCFERTEPPHDLARGEDGLPPLVLAPADRPYTFRVLEVRDDGDTYPSADGTIPGRFSWQWRRREGEKTSPFTRLTDVTRTFLLFEAGSFRPGDELEVRVDYRDRQPDEAYPCLTDSKVDRCESPTTKGCYHRVSWRLRFIP
jgi:hypothetical protein